MRTGSMLSTIAITTKVVHMAGTLPVTELPVRRIVVSGCGLNSGMNY